MDTLCIQQKCNESALSVQQIDVAKEIKFRSRYMMSVYHCNINNPEYHVRRRFDREPSRIHVKKLGKLHQTLISDIETFTLALFIV